MTRRALLRSLLTTALWGGASTLGVSAVGVSATAAQERRAGGDGRAPDSVRRAIRTNDRYAGARIGAIRIRRPAPTNAGYMYEVVMRPNGGREYFVYVDPDTSRILFDTL